MIFNGCIEFHCVAITLFNQSPINTIANFSLLISLLFLIHVKNCFSENYQFIIPQVAYERAYLPILPPTLNLRFKNLLSA